MRSCSCGVENPDDAFFCKSCGSHFVQAKKEAPQERWSSLEALRSVSSRTKKRRRVIILGCVALSLAVAGLVTFFILSHIEEGPVASASFTSKYSGLSFVYPGDWERKANSYLKQLFKSVPVGDVGNEVVLLKRGSSLFRHLLIVSSSTVASTDAKWEAIEPNLKENLMDAAQEQSFNVSFFHVKTPPGTNGFGMEFVTPQSNGSTFFQLQGVIVRKNICYTLFLSTPLNGGGADEGQARILLHDIVSSVKFI